MRRRLGGRWGGFEGGQKGTLCYMWVAGYSRELWSASGQRGRFVFGGFLVFGGWSCMGGQTRLVSVTDGYTMEYQNAGRRTDCSPHVVQSENVLARVITSGDADFNHISLPSLK